MSAKDHLIFVQTPSGMRFVKASSPSKGLEAVIADLKIIARKATVDDVADHFHPDLLLKPQDKTQAGQA
jgi:hypothetical protein